MQYQLRTAIVEIQVIKGFNARKQRFPDGSDGGFTPLLPGTYSGEINSDGDLSLAKANGELALISFEKRQEKIDAGFLIILN